MRQKRYLIAGPCSVESREQLFEVAQALADVPELSMVRCGIWKPRTRPGGFEGLGEEALKWIAEYRGASSRQVRFCCEVARPEHVELALKYAMDAVWIGARTTANPFMVQELAEALRGTGLQVLVKNAPSPDVRLWMGSIERCRQAGITDIVAVHRGFDLFENSGYRNSPLWEVPIELRRCMPEVPLICDPSHIAGRRDPILSLSQTALDLGFDGLMVEVHPHPDQALTDADQQITPESLSLMLSQLVLRQTDTAAADEELRVLREQIDDIDQRVLQLLAQRMSVSMRIANVKAKTNLAVYQPKRWEQVLQQRMAVAEERGLSADFVKELYEKIHAESVRLQEDMVNGRR